ncbi:MAG: hypothetical protein KF735_07730 [Chelatococcus sp.]|uniref:hypothetical protein n=1 Tax=unclassified Chelatococcus TaxID=2638111 RepID=UPI001BCC1136|nr:MULTISPECIES: hypothetical protein [unclassified Chelatococcus]MBS7742086.1 hypothetical protein [Chelatococcus sp. HY11]MBX3537510.1 hypothetical protein [Chelatococcus sp.]MBX3541116.1 hypothetical protein [Chelatococcus sp.]MCO5074989.1 hypothetical protein [Chelatococcus sp.]
MRGIAVVLRPVSWQLQGYNNLIHHFFAQMETRCRHRRGQWSLPFAVAAVIHGKKGTGTAVGFSLVESSIPIHSPAYGVTAR